MLISKNSAFRLALLVDGRYMVINNVNTILGYIRVIDANNVELEMDGTFRNMKSVDEAAWFAKAYEG